MTATESAAPRLRGKARVLELAAEAALDAKVELAALLADLGEQPSAAQRALAEQAAFLIVRCRQLRRWGRWHEAESCSMLLTRVMGRLGVKPGDAKRAGADWSTYLAAAAAGGTTP